MPVIKNCRYCDNEFKISPSEIDTIHFCSKQCRKKFYQIPCDYCGKMFKPDKRNSNSTTKTCSIKCRGLLRRIKKLQMICTNCGKEFEKYPSQIRENQEMFFCSKTCMNKCKEVKQKRIVSQRSTKTTNMQWKPIGTIYKRNRKGRTDVFIKVATGKGTKNWMLYHRWIIEQHIGRPLNRDEEIHHLDGNETNNCIDNLAVISKIDHSLMTKLLKIVDYDLSKTIVLTLLARFPSLQNEVKVQLSPNRLKR